MTDVNTATAMTGGAVATGISIKNSAMVRSFSDATVVQVMDGSFQLYMSDILAVVGVIGLVLNLWLGWRRERRLQQQNNQRQETREGAS